MTFPLLGPRQAGRSQPTSFTTGSSATPQSCGRRRDGQQCAITQNGFADAWEHWADTQPDARALVQGDRVVTWREFDRRADGLAQCLLDAGLGRQSKVAQYLYNMPEYSESVFAACKVGMVPVNSNYRYVDDELVYLWDDADVEAVVFDGRFSERIARIRARVPRVALWLWVGTHDVECPEWATPYEHAASSVADRTRASWGRSPDDLLLLYTGGTTGMPKGVMWRQGDICTPLDPTTDAERAAVERAAPMRHRVVLPTCPLMHGTGLFTSNGALAGGGTVVTLAGRSFDPIEALDAVERHGVNHVVVVGDAFAKPILRSLEAHPGRWDLSSLQSMSSSGVMWSESVKRGLLSHHPPLVLTDSFASSEALGMGSSISTAENTAGTARFVLGPNARVIGDDGRDVVAGSGAVGRLAVTGLLPLGYYKDEEKTRRTFVTIDGALWCVPGDLASVESDGSIRLLGRGALCINTAGEKVFPEEVEEVVKTHPDVDDCLVVGVSSERFGEEVSAVVQLRDGAALAADELRDWLHGRIAGYKIPRTVVLRVVRRAPNGKADYAWAREQFEVPASRDGASERAIGGPG